MEVIIGTKCRANKVGHDGYVRDEFEESPKARTGRSPQVKPNWLQTTNIHSVFQGISHIRIYDSVWEE